MRHRRPDVPIGIELDVEAAPGLLWKSGEITEDMLPRTTNMRRVLIMEGGRRPVLWVGSNRGASIVKGEPLE